MRKKLFCVIIPAYNEEKVIKASLSALKKIVPKEDIYVVSDGSSDNTVPLAYSASVNVLALQDNFGKAKAILHLIRSFNLTLHYKYILFSDADSRLSKDFIQQILPLTESNPACIVGNVTSDRHGFISAFRTYEYGLSNFIYKNAQNTMKMITVAPGCASFYRSDVLQKLNFSNKTLTEDFDLTLQIHKKKLGQIVYASKAKVITQDPPTIKDYWNQVVRWDTGFWQNIFLHRLYLPDNKIKIEIYLLFLDFIACMVTITYLAFHPSFLVKFIISMFAMIIILSTILAVVQKKYWIIVYSPLFPFVYFLNIIAYIFSFFRAITGKNHKLSWKKVARYKV